MICWPCLILLHSTFEIEHNVGDRTTVLLPWSSFWSLELVLLEGFLIPGTCSKERPLGRFLEDVRDNTDVRCTNWDYADLDVLLKMLLKNKEELVRA